MEEPWTDWNHLPGGQETRILWDCLHDAELRSSVSDLLNRAVERRFNVAHLVEDNPELEIIFRFEAVTSARIVTFAIWPGEYVRPPGITREEETRLVEEYQSKWREESLGWTEFESLLSTHTVDIHDADLAEGPSNRAIKLRGSLAGDRYDHRYCEIFLRFEAFTIRTSENHPVSLEEFEQLGEAYWEAFAARIEAKDRERESSS